MDFEKLLNDCETIENNVSFLIDDNARKKVDLSKFQADILQSSDGNLNQLVDYEHRLLIDLESLKSRKNELDTKLKQLTDINDKLSSIVSTAQKANNEKKDHKNNHVSVYMSIAATINKYEHTKVDYLKVFEEIGLLKINLEEDLETVKDVLKLNKELNICLQRNDNILRLIEQQNKHVEQQFDLILNQLPWEPLSDRYFQELRNSNEEIVRNMADVLMIQTNDLKDLSESIEIKKNRKLQILEELKIQLDNFAKKREEAIMMSDNYRSLNNMLSRK